MGLFTKKRGLLKDLVLKYFEQANSCIRVFHDSISLYFEKGLVPDFEIAVTNTHREESKADDLRREIESELYTKSFNPQICSDILSLLENADKIPNKCESILYKIYLQNMRIPGKYTEEFGELIKININAYKTVHVDMKDLFLNREEIKLLTSGVDDFESQSDKLERKMIKEVFDDPSIDKADRILFKELILEIGSISDFSLDLADKITITALKVKF
ncbi:MAG: DUF47 family protein [bacterium]|nr:DUF47 family protein [bacterium]